MTSVGFSGEWILFSCDTKLVAIHIKEFREPFVFDCSSAEKPPKVLKDDSNSNGGSTEDTGSDEVLAVAVSSSGKLVALTDDAKRLVLFQREPSWHCISIRWVVRRCTSLVFSQAEDELLVADKSGDVYSFSVVEPQREGELMMGHLSMLLSVVISPDNKYIITADRDEKIRVSHHRSPFNIQSFCLGHHQFVSALHVPHRHPHWLLSGSGDGTVKLWEFESGRRLQSWDLSQPEETQGSDLDKNAAVVRISSSSDGCHVAVFCERVSTVHVFTLDQEQKLVPHSRLHLDSCPLDVNFDLDGRLWVLMDSSDAPLQVYMLRQNSWKGETDSADLHRVTEALRPHWSSPDASRRTSSHLDQLYKVGFDNVSVYLQKKQQRLEEQQQKRTKAQTSNSSKRTKKEQHSSGIQPSD